MKICELQPELHFSSIEDQLEEIRTSVREGVDWRRHNVAEENNILTTTEQQVLNNNCIPKMSVV